MPSFRCKIKKLRFQGILTDKETNRILDALDKADKTAEWLESNIPFEKYVCSKCGGACWSYDVDRYICKSRYCPNCGAKMKEGDKE